MKKYLRDVMTTDVETVQPQTSLAEAAEQMKKENIGSLAVCENRELIGMITDRDIVVKGIARHPDAFQSLTVADIMSKDVVAAKETDRLKKATKLMKHKEIRRIPVVNDRRHLVGIWSLADKDPAHAHHKARRSRFASSLLSLASIGLLVGLGSYVWKGARVSA